MAPYSKRVFAKIREKNRKLILKNSLKLFARYSFTRTTVEQIAQKCNFSKGLIYNYFESKDEILKEILKDGVEKFLNNLQSFNELKTEEDLKQVIEIIIKTIVGNKDFFKLYFSLFNESVLTKKFQRELLDEMQFIISLFTTYYKNKGDKNPHLTALALMSALDGLATDYITLSSSLPIKELAQIIYERFK